MGGVAERLKCQLPLCVTADFACHDLREVRLDAHSWQACVFCWLEIGRRTTLMDMWVLTVLRTI